MTDELSLSQWARLSKCANLRSIDCMYGLPDAPGRIRMQFPKLERLVLGPQGILSSRLAQVCGLTSLRTLELRRSLRADIDSAVPARLMQLCTLQKLSINGFESISPEIAEVTALQSLEVQLEVETGLLKDMSNFVHLTALQVRGSRDCTVGLPVGSGVQLQQLTVESSCSIQNLDDATALTFLHMLPMHVHQTAWPVNLPNLQHLLFFDPNFEKDGSFLYGVGVVYEFPSQWQNYTSLVALKAAFCSLKDGLPQWLTALQQLKVLDLPYGIANDLFGDLVHLTQLEVLNLNYFDTILTDNLMAFADYPALTCLHFGCLDYMEGVQNGPVCRFSDDDMQLLLKLEGALQARPRRIDQMQYPAEAGKLDPSRILTFAEQL